MTPMEGCSHLVLISKVFAKENVAFKTLHVDCWKFKSSVSYGYSRMDQVKFVEVSLLKILLGPFLNIFIHISHKSVTLCRT